MFFANVNRRRLSTHLSNPIRLPAALLSPPRGESAAGQLLGACLMIGFFLVMALFG